MNLPAINGRVSLKELLGGSLLRSSASLKLRRNFSEALAKENQTLLRSNTFVLELRSSSPFAFIPGLKSGVFGEGE